jgi:4-hydroxy-tetrahydrodipicolinate synthase
MLREFPGFDVFPASEAFLLQGLRAGACGSITATGNINPAGIRELFDNWQTDRADGIQERVAEIRRTVQAYPLIPAVKVIVAHFLDEPDWRRLCPPLTTLNDAQARVIIDRLSEIQFEFAPAETAGVQTG